MQTCGLLDKAKMVSGGVEEGAGEEEDGSGQGEDGAGLQGRGGGGGLHQLVGGRALGGKHVKLGRDRI